MKTQEVNQNGKSECLWKEGRKKGNIAERENENGGKKLRRDGEEAVPWERQERKIIPT